jgi:hypothetical protein
VARVQALITSTTGVLTEAAARKGQYRRQHHAAAGAGARGQPGGVGLGRRSIGGELTSPASRTDPRWSAQPARPVPRSRLSSPARPDRPQPTSTPAASTSQNGQDLHSASLRRWTLPTSSGTPRLVTQAWLLRRASSA